MSPNCFSLHAEGDNVTSEGAICETTAWLAEIRRSERETAAFTSGCRFVGDEMCKPPHAKSRLHLRINAVPVFLPVSQWQKHRRQTNTRAKTGRQGGGLAEAQLRVARDTKIHLHRLRTHICFCTFSSENRMTHLRK